MKTKNVILMSLFIASFMLIASNYVSAQTSKAMGKCEQTCMKSNQDYSGKSYKNIPDLSIEQQTKIDDLKLKLRKELLPLNLKLDEAKARLNSIETADAVQSMEVDAIIDQISSLQNQKMKLKARHKQDVRKLLNEKQRVDYDTKCCSSKKQMNCGKKDGKMGCCNKGGNK